ncbi:ribosome recycling factor, partial [Vibrio parahaemolyticus IDH02189]
SVVTQTTI